MRYLTPHSVAKRCVEKLVAPVFGSGEVTDVYDLCERVAVTRGRPIQLIPFVFLTPAITALYVKTASVDCFLVEPDIDREFQIFSVCHEIGHCLLEHGCEGDADIVQSILPRLPPEVVKVCLQRSYIGTRAELEAEEVATLLTSRLTRRTALQSEVPCTPMDAAFGTSTRSQPC